MRHKENARSLILHLLSAADRAMLDLLGSSIPSIRLVNQRDEL
jgi:hypothetical protein